MGELYLIIKKNCWEVRECGREPQGKKVDVLGVCPAATQEQWTGVNHGKAAGRLCWTVGGTPCDSPAGLKFFRCLQCSFYKQVEQEEGRFFVLGIGFQKQTATGVREK